MPVSGRLLGACALSLLAALATPASAQQADLLRPRLNALTTQPINVIIGFYNLEYERVISSSTSLGLQTNFSNSDIGDIFDESESERYFSMDAKIRYYPGGQPLRGFSVGATAGLARFSERTTECSFFGGCSGLPPERISATGAKVGFELDYNWLLGVDEKFVVALGVGAKRLVIDDARSADGYIAVDYPQTYPTARIAIGFAW